MILPSSFRCPQCHRLHPIETLLEFPLPEQISKITSGKASGDLVTIAKNVYKVDAELHMYVNLIIPIKEYFDNFEVQNWIRISTEGWRKFANSLKTIAKENTYGADVVTITGEMLYPIPMYGMSDFPIVKVSFPPKDLLPEVRLVNSTGELYQDWKNGISLKRLEYFNSVLNGVVA